ncbi:group II intron maturase-specific domain-containing protein [uncultured Thiodictyon sp.]|uniref:group II intron maturase-specific domain-containing protein n=1 Tax=uncultured Thiodictyon sp. TaxID=1846217 RepID=UPI0025E085D9|nr:group II intron maturase-specific domain-containing protein [uncultured Thiodictyon sp.]
MLGFRIHPGGHVSPAPKAIERLKDRVCALWDARQSVTTKQLRDQWQRYITGWWNYYGYAN